MQPKYRTVEDLLKEESFINYCLRKNEQDVHYWEQYVAEHPDRKALVEEAVQEYRLLFSALANADLEDQLNDLKKRMANSEGAQVVELKRAARSHTPFYRRFSYVAVAALAVITIGVYLYRKEQRIPTPQTSVIQYACKPGE